MMKRAYEGSAAKAPEIRGGSAADLAAVFSIADSWKDRQRKVYYQDEVTRGALRAGIENGKKQLLIAGPEGRVVGFVIYEIRGASAFIHPVVVSHGHARTGIGSDWIRDVARLHGRVEAFNDVGPEMKPIYEKLGFRCADKI